MSAWLLFVVAVLWVAAVGEIIVALEARYARMRRQGERRRVAQAAAREAIMLDVDWRNV